MNPNGCAAIVTGGASGLGEATARALAEAGAKVAIFDLNEARAARLAEDLAGISCAMDISDDGAVERAFATARAAHGQERILVNCAGVGNVHMTIRRSRKTGAITRFPMHEFERVIRINLIGTFRCLSASAAGMATLDPLADDEKGVIINTASIAAIDGQAGQAAYAASKAAIVGMTLPIARDLMHEGIRVNTILPGAFDTPLLATADPGLLAEMTAAVPFPKRLGKPREFASMALEICRNAYMNGEHIRLDGALRLPPR